MGGYSSMLKDKKDLENENRLENIKELLSAMKEFDNLECFLEHVSLATSVDQEWDGEKINLMTMHAAKGLEFEVVFLPGWEEGLFPHQKSLEEKGDFALEEERRLAYVGITRAKKEAYLSFAMKRAYHGDWMDALPSRFINEIPDESIEKIEKLKKIFKIEKIDGYIIPKNDEFFGEYIPEYNDRLNFISNFSGSYGFALILRDKNYLFVDGRYTLQAYNQCGKAFKIITIPDKMPVDVLRRKKLKIGFDPNLFTEKTLSIFFGKSECKCKPIIKNL